MVSYHLEKYMNCVHLRKIGFVSQYALERMKKSTEFGEIIHSRYFHKHVD